MLPRCPRERGGTVQFALSEAEEAFAALRAATPGGAARVALAAGTSLLEEPLRLLEESFATLSGALAPAEDTSPLAALAERTAELAANLARIAAVDELEGARTLQTTPRGFTLSLLPL